MKVERLGLATIALSVVYVTPASLVVGQSQIYKLTAPDGAGGDSFGRTVAVSSDFVVVGAPLDNGAGQDSGSVYVFDTVTGQVRYKLVAADGDMKHRFGVSVAIEEDLLAVGARQDDENGPNSGSVYIFAVSSGQLITKITASDGAPGDNFGRRVALNDGLLLVGARLSNDLGDRSGSAYLFEAQTGQELYKLTTSDGQSDDEFGWSVALDGGLLAVGAGFANPGEAGAAYGFSAVTGSELYELVASDATSGDNLGRTIAIGNGLIAVGARFTTTGAVYVYRADTGVELLKLVSSDGQPGDQFGFSVAIQESLLVVGAAHADGGAPESGAAYVYELNAGIELTKMIASDGASEDRFGYSVAINGDYIVVGARYDDDVGIDSGSAYVFQLADCNGNGVPDSQDIATGASLDCNTNAVPDECDLASGTSEDCNLNQTPDECDLDSGVLTDCDENGVPDQCEVIQDCNDNQIPDSCDIGGGASQDCNSNGVPDECDISSGSSQDCGGNGIPDECEPDCNGNGVPDDCDIGQGTSQDGNGNGIPDECECFTINYCTTSPNTVGPGVLLGSVGLPSISVNDFVLVAVGGPPAQTGIFYYGSTQASQPFGEGTRCVGGITFRLEPPVQIDSMGRANHQLDFEEPPANGGLGEIVAGSTWYFQFWYRDPLGGPAGFNFSDGLEVTFCP